MLWAYGVVLKDSLQRVCVITINMETHAVQQMTDKESSHEQKAGATDYLTGLIKQILPIQSMPPVAPAVS